MDLRNSKILSDYLNGTIKNSDFEKWIYSEKSLENNLGNELYIELVSLDFKDKSIKNNIKNLIESEIDYGNLHKQEIIELIDNTLDRKISLMKSISSFYDWATKGYSSIDAFRNAHGAAGNGKAWHHIVSQRSSNIAKFGSNQIHNTKNLVKLPHGKGTWHQRITNFYNTINPPGYNTQGLRFGQWLAQKPYSEQYKIGLEIMNLLK